MRYFIWQKRLQSGQTTEISIFISNGGTYAVENADTTYENQTAEQVDALLEQWQVPAGYGWY